MPGCGCSTPTAAKRKCAATASAASPSTSTITASLRKPTLTIETGRGVLTLEVEASGGKVRQVRVDMGEPILKANEIPTTLPGDPPIEVPLDLPDHRSLAVTCVSMGNPHCVTFVDEVTDALVLGIGPRVENHPAFPRRINAEFVQVNRPDDVTVRVWERGSGETLACGTGACAVAVAGVLTRRTRTADHGASARRRLAAALGGEGQPRLHDGAGRGSVQRRMAGINRRLRLSRLGRKRTHEGKEVKA